MHVTVKGKNTAVDERLKARAESKLSKLERFSNQILTMDVEFSEERNPRVRDPHRVEVTCTTTSLPIRAEASGPETIRTMAAEAAPLPEGTPTPTMESEYERRVVRRKQAALKPMGAGEAAMMMDLLGHDFFLFSDAETDCPAVVYRRRDGDFGVLVGEAGANPAAG
jgi:putative sigma-54 modulation protein